jgi:hypothetical protein
MSNKYEFQNSSMLQSCDYDDEKCILTITFHKGSKDYRYADVSKPVYEDLKNAESSGKFFLNFIKPVFELVTDG